MFNTLLLTDFSENAKEAADFYLLNNPQEQERVLIYHNIEYPVGQVDSDVSLEALTESTSEDLKAEYSRIKQKHSAVNIDTTHSAGSLSSSVNDLIEDFKIDLLVMGAPHERSFVEVLAGSDTAKEVLKANGPALICPPGNGKKKIEEIIVVSFSDQPLEEEPFEVLKKLTRGKGCSINVLLVAENDKEKQVDSEKELFFQKQFPDSSVSITMVQRESTTEQVEYFSKTLNADLVAFMPEEKNFLAELFTENTEKKLINQLDQPLLILQKQ